MRIAIAGFQHETNTFAPGYAGIEQFRMADSWPGLLIGDAVVTDTRNLNLPIAGAVAAADGVELVPLLWCAAEPSGPVTDAAFEWITNQILDGVRTALPLDGIYLDLHGAMVTESHDDGEGAFLTRLRGIVGLDLPIGVSLDLHANVSPAMMELATLVTVFRSYPHLDMAETGARCMQNLRRAISGTRLSCAFRQVPFLIPLHAQYTDQAPCKELYRLVEEVSETPDTYADLALGFTAADVHDCGPSILAYAHTERQANHIADTILDAICAAEHLFDTSLVTASDAVEQALNTRLDKPVLIADVQDNPGAGGTADSTGLLHSLVKYRAQNAVIGVICDPEISKVVHDAGVGNTINMPLGAKSDLPDQLPLQSQFRILALSDGSIDYSGEMYAGGVAELGPSCLLEIRENGSDIRIVVSSQRIQCLDQALFSHFGVNLCQEKIICVKSTVHYRADFEPIVGKIINAAAPGVFTCQLSLDQFQHLRKGVRCL